MNDREQFIANLRREREAKQAAYERQRKEHRDLLGLSHTGQARTQCTR